MIDIAKARALCEAATKGPWEYDSLMVGNATVDVAEIMRGEDLDEPNAVFIAAARTLLPEALDALEAAHRREAVAAALLEKAGAEVDALKKLLAEVRPNTFPSKSLLARIDAKLKAKS